jgi:hypothetical protein
VVVFVIFVVWFWGFHQQFQSIKNQSTTTPTETQKNIDPHNKKTQQKIPATTDAPNTPTNPTKITG